MVLFLELSIWAQEIFRRFGENVGVSLTSEITNCTHFTGWFHVCLCFLPYLLGKMIQFDSYFSDGLKAPTSLLSLSTESKCTAKEITWDHQRSGDDVFMNVESSRKLREILPTSSNQSDSGRKKTESQATLAIRRLGRRTPFLGSCKRISREQVHIPPMGNGKSSTQKCLSRGYVIVSGRVIFC